MTYKLTITEADYKDICFVGNRYCWSDTLLDYVNGPGEIEFDEGDAWEIKEAFEADTEGDHQFFPMLNGVSSLALKLMKFYNSIV